MSGRFLFALSCFVLMTNGQTVAQETNRLPLQAGLQAWTRGSTPLSAFSHDRTGESFLGADSVSLKSPFLAFALSAIATGVPVAYGLSLDGKQNETAGGLLFAGGLILGPAMGFFYGEEWGRGMTGVGIRAGLTGVSVLLMASSAGSSHSFGEAVGGAMVVGALGVLAVGVDAIYDLIVVGPSISEQNDTRQVFSISMSPVYRPDSRSMGFHITISI